MFCLIDENDCKIRQAQFHINNSFVVLTFAKSCQIGYEMSITKGSDCETTVEEYQ